jgi:transcriptional regulator with GAF, ATPase, and Fis domain
MSGLGSNDNLDQLAAEVARARGEAFFPAFAKCVAEVLDASETLIAKTSSGNRARTLAAWANATAKPNYKYELAGTPCEAVLGGNNVHVEFRVVERFPRAFTTNAGYFGIPLSSSDGRVIGHFCAYRPGSLPLSDQQKSFCEILAARASTELQLRAAERERIRLHAQNRYLQGEIKADYNADSIVGDSPALERLRETVRRVAATDAPAIIWGETGTGKELIARAIHAGSHRAERPFIKFDCAALMANEVDHLLFGHQTDGHLALADGGTLFLDEVGALRAPAQSALLGQLQDAHRAGSGGTSQFDVRVIAASSRDLRKAVRDGEFLEALFQRLDVFPVDVPPLRARVEDIPTLVQFFLKKHASRVGRRVDGVDPDTLAALSRYPWPGNVRELDNLVERALILNASTVLKIPAQMLAVYSSAERAVVAAAASGTNRSLPTAADTLAEGEPEATEQTGLHHVQRTHILRVLNATNWVIEGNSGAALKLGMKAATLRHRMKKLGIARASAPPAA